MRYSVYTYIHACQHRMPKSLNLRPVIAPSGTERAELVYFCIIMLWYDYSRLIILLLII